MSELAVTVALMLQTHADIGHQAAARILAEAAAGTTTERAVIELVLRAGLRGTEVAGIARRHFTPTLGRPTLLAGTKYRPRTIALAPSVGAAVSALLRESEADISAPLVPGLSPVALVQLVRGVCRRAGVDVGVHDLRRTAIAAVLDAGVAAMDVEAYFGFSVSGAALVGVRPGRDVAIAAVLERAFA